MIKINSLHIIFKIVCKFCCSAIKVDDVTIGIILDIITRKHRITITIINYKYI